MVIQACVEQQEICANKVASQVICEVPGDQSSPRRLQLCDFFFQGIAAPPIVIPLRTGNANSTAFGHVERRYEPRLPQRIPQQTLVIPLYVIHVATLVSRTLRLEQSQLFTLTDRWRPAAGNVA